VGRVISMNQITKRSFYSFLTLYLVSSFIFLTLASYWFYNSQLQAELNTNFHKMNNIANTVASDVIFAHMMDEPFILKSFPDVNIALFDAKKTLHFGSLLQNVDFDQTYYKDGGVFNLISTSTASHLDIEYVVVQSNQCTKNVEALQKLVLYTSFVVALFIIIIAVILSYIFLKPIKDKMQEVDNFIKDTTHELNTPISALMMSTSRAKEKKLYDEKIMTNISISTKQLYDIYSSLTFINFDTTQEKDQELSFDSIVDDSIKYFDELVERKNIHIHHEITPCHLLISPTKAKMLINNLLSNAIKYSPPKTKIRVQLDQNKLIVEDEGIGIESSQLQTIFKKFVRGTSHAGGFGIGLHIVNRIVNEYEYSIKIDSKPNKGTLVSIHFHH
jgi:two-component system OmpR family sensor kinase